MRAEEVVRRWAGNVLGGIIMLLMAGCWAVPIPTDSPFESRPPKSLVGSKKKIVREKLGQPRHELKDNNKSYFVYRGYGEAWGVLFFMYFPVLPYPVESENPILHCVLLEFDESDILRRYDKKTRSKMYWSNLYQIDCRSLFWSEEELAQFKDVEPPDVSTIKVGTNKLKLEAIFGEPITTRDTEDGRVSVYRYRQSRFTSISYSASTTSRPLYWRDGAFLAVEYTPEDTFVSAEMRPGSESTEEAIEYLMKMVKVRQELSRALAALEKRARSGEPEAMYEYSAKLNDPLEAWQWKCVAAHKSHGRAQFEIAKTYEDGRDLASKDLTLAYVWYILAKTNGVTKSEAGKKYYKTATGWACCLPGKRREEVVAELLSEEELLEAKRLIAEWQPNPAECGLETAVTAE